VGWSRRSGSVVVSRIAVLVCTGSLVAFAAGGLGSARGAAAPSAHHGHRGGRCHGGHCAAARLALSLPATAQTGARVRAHGTIVPVPSNASIVVQRKDGGHWRALGHTPASRRFAASFSAPATPTTWRVRAVAERGRRVLARSRVGRLVIESSPASSSSKPAGVAGPPSPAPQPLALTAEPVTVAIGSTAPVPATAPLTSLEALDGTASGGPPGVSLTVSNGVAVVTASTAAATGVTSFAVSGSGCTAEGCGQHFELTVPVRVRSIAAPAGALEEIGQPSPDRIAAAVDNHLTDELLVTLGSPDLPGDRASAEAVAAHVGAVVAGGLEDSGIYQLRWASSQDLEARTAELEAEPEVTSVGFSTVGLYTAASAYPVATEFDQPWLIWPYEQVHALGAWSQASGSDVTVGIIDEGNVFAAHPDLGPVATNQISVPKLHATHVAGLACAKANSIGMVGLAKGCPLVSLGIDYADNGDDAVLQAMHEMAAWPGVRVVNISLGLEPEGGGCANAPTQAKIVAEVRKNKGSFEHFLAGKEGKRIVWVMSAGNNCAPGPASPFGANSQLPNVISVAATNQGGSLASFSNFGAGVEVAAPGGIAFSPLPTIGLMSTVVDRCSSGYCAGYREDRGTSMAAPVVAGIAALVRSAHPGFTADEAGACITSSAGTGGVGSASMQSSFPTIYQPVLPYSGSTPIVNADAAVKCIARHTAISYAGSGGGDGWAVALTPNAVYNVFHHDSSLQLACHFQADASPCWFPETETIRDDDGNGFASSGQPGMWLDQTSRRLYVYATRSSDERSGVVCIDTIEAATDPNPFCGFTALTGPGESPLESGISPVSNPALVGSRWYAFNYVDQAPVSGAENKLLCFDVNTLAPCPGQPFSVSANPGNASSTDFPPPAVTAIGKQVIVPMRFEGGEDELACFDGNAEAGCAGNWPVTVGTYNSIYGAAFPLLDGAGALAGLCLPTGLDPCFSLGGALLATPANMAEDAIPANTAWNGPALIRGTKVYVPNGLDDAVDCYDYASGDSCAGYPRSLSDLGLLYTVNPDPERPRCIWVNADNGAGQIQAFDAEGGSSCE
jgi:Subtilase family